MSKDKTQDDYEVGYRKPPKNSQFQKGISGNPRGRPKKSFDFDYELIKESMFLMTINENGTQRRISKHEVAIKQLMKQAMTGSTQCLRTYFDPHRQALERVTMSASQQSSDSERYKDVDSLTDEELMRIAASGPKKTE